MVHNMKGSIIWGKSKEKGTFCGLINQVIKGLSMRITFMGMGFISGPMAENIMVNGKITKWMEKVSLPGQMDESILENTLMIRKKVMVNLYGLIIVNTKVPGKTENNMGRVFISVALVKNDRVNGQMAED